MRRPFQLWEFTHTRRLLTSSSANPDCVTTPTPPFVHSLFLAGRPLTTRTRELLVRSLEDIHREQNTESGQPHRRRARPPAGTHLHLCPDPSHHQPHLAEGACAPHKVKAEHLGLPFVVLCYLGSHLLGCLQSRLCPVCSVCPPGVQTRFADVNNYKERLDKNPVVPEPGARSWGPRTLKSPDLSHHNKLQSRG